MKRFSIGTTALCIVAIEVEAEDEEGALRKASEALNSQWQIVSICGQVDLDEGTYEVSECEGPR